jgi:hypothetical protein
MVAAGCGQKQGPINPTNQEQVSESPPERKPKIEVCIPKRVLSKNNSRCQATSSCPWTIEKVEFMAEDTWASWINKSKSIVKLSDHQDPKLGQVLLPPAKARTPEDVLCEELANGDYQVRIKVRLDEQTGPGPHSFHYQGTLKVTVPNSDLISPPNLESRGSLIFPLGDTMLQPFCHWQGSATLKRSDKILLYLMMIPSGQPDEKAKTEACLEVQPEIE